MTKNLKPHEFPELSWDEADLSSSLKKMYDYAKNEADAAIDWYSTKKRKKKFAGITLRFLAMIIAALAGIIPIINQIVDSQRLVFNPAWASVAIAVVALFYALDKFGGYTSGWIRFMLAQQELNQNLEVFRFEWERNMLEFKGKSPSKKEALEALEHCKTFMINIHQIIRKETDKWAIEFQNVLKEMEKAAKESAQIKELGAVSIELENHDKFEEGWYVQVDNGSKRHCQGRTAVEENLSPRIHKFRISGKKNDRMFSVEKLVNIQSGQIAEIKVKLE